MRWFLPACSLLLLGAATAPALWAEDPPPPAPAPKAPGTQAPGPQAPGKDDADTQILGWVADLGSDDFATREQASRRLEAAGARARQALEAALKSSDSLEVRWRAQQILLRLDGQRERPLGQPGTGGPDEAPPAEEPQESGQKPRPGARLDDLRERMERWMRALEKDWGRPMPDLGLGGLLPPMGLMGETLKQGGLTLTVPILPGAPWRLHVAARPDGEPRGRTYTGPDLESIVQEEPALAQHPDLPGLRSQVKRHSEEWPRGLGGGFHLGGGPGNVFTFQSSEGLEVRQDANGAVVRYQEQGPDGKPVWKEVRGASLDEIREKHPELAARLSSLGGIHLHFGPPVVIRRPGRDGFHPLEEPVPPPAPEPQREVRFGLGLVAVEEVLALHLRLGEGEGLLVASVEPGSQAEALGVERLDVLVAIDGKPVTDSDAAIQALRAAARTKAPLALEVVRQGQRRTLTR